MIYGLTGGMGSGKSTVAAMLRDKGYVVLDADEIGREVTDKGEPLLRLLVKEFGIDIIREDGTLDSVTILNLSIGDTDELKVRVRNPASERAFLQGVKLGLSPIALEHGAAANERVAVIPNLSGWQIATIFFGL